MEKLTGFKSSNVKDIKYDQDANKLYIQFLNKKDDDGPNVEYIYKDVIERDYVRFEVSESQGSVFNKTMRKYEFDKLEKIEKNQNLV